MGVHQSVSLSEELWQRAAVQLDPTRPMIVTYVIAYARRRDWQRAHASAQDEAWQVTGYSESGRYLLRAIRDGVMRADDIAHDAQRLTRLAAAWNGRLWAVQFEQLQPSVWTRLHVEAQRQHVATAKHPETVRSDVRSSVSA